MSGHCPKCGEYCEEDDSRPCDGCAKARNAMDKANRYGEPWSDDDVLIEHGMVKVCPSPLQWSRAVACVNALAGVDDPEAYIASLRTANAALTEQVAQMVRLPEIPENHALRIDNMSSGQENQLFGAYLRKRFEPIEHTGTGPTPAAALSALSAKIEQEKNDRA